MTVIHIVSSLEPGGMERFAIRLASAQQQQRHRVAIFALRGGPLEEEASRLGVPVIVLGTSRSNRIVATMRHAFRFRADIIHAHNPTSLHYAVLARFLSGARVIMTDHGQGGGPGRRPTTFEIRQTDAIVAVSRSVAMRSADREEIRERTIVIHNAVSAEAPRNNRASVRAALGLGDEPVGLVIGSLNAVKGHALLLEALATLASGMRQPTVLLAGDGPERASLMQRAASLGVGEKVRFLGFRRDIPDLLGAVDFLIMPSLNEGLPLALLEAMGQGVPVIATAVGGVPEVAEHERTALLVPPQDTRALAAAIDRLSGDSGLRARLSAGARTAVQASFSHSAMVGRYTALYQRIIDGQAIAGRRGRTAVVRHAADLRPGP